MRNLLRTSIAVAACSVMVVGAAYASLSPGQQGRAAREAATGADLAHDVVLAGAAKVNLAPNPEKYHGVWERDASKCQGEDQAYVERLLTNTQEEVDHLAVAGSPWNENPNCLYMGGFGIGPANPITSFDQTYGMWVRSSAFFDGTDWLVLTVIDAEGYLWDYASKCTDCGWKQINESVGAELGIPASHFVGAATHSHSGMDYLGGWGFVPDWYMKQTKDAIKQSITEAVHNAVPATLEVGEVEARPWNNERRDTYRSAEEQQLEWLRAVSTSTHETIATIGSYAAHPTSHGTNHGVASSDWVGPFEKHLEDRFGGIGMHFMTGLGNMSHTRGDRGGVELADLVPGQGGGTLVTNPDIRVSQATWSQPLSNVPLTALGTAGFFDRKFDSGPAELRTGKSPDTAPCESVSPTSVTLATSAARIGNAFALTASPGEIFSNISNTIKEKSGADVTMPLGQANDALGYMPQSFELNPVGQQGLGFAISGVAVVNYEDSYAVDRCVGDAALENALSLLGSVK